jgi:hypothetical protein
MTIADLDLIHHPAKIEGDTIRVRHLSYSAEGFVLSGLKLVDYSEEEQRELVRLGILTSRK